MNIPQVSASQFQVLGGPTFAAVGGNPRSFWQMNKANFHASRLGASLAPQLAAG